jgi:hypothetical protein
MFLIYKYISYFSEIIIYCFITLGNLFNFSHYVGMIQKL